MGVLLKKSDFNWIPKSAFHFALVNDIIRLKDSVRWILEEAEVIKKCTYILSI